MPSAEDIKERIETAIAGAEAEVEDYTGGGDHFSATVTAPAFEGLSRIAQHRLVYDVFGAPESLNALARRAPRPVRQGGRRCARRRRDGPGFVPRLTWPRDGPCP